MKTQDYLKTFQPWFKKLQKNSIPAIQYMEVRNGKARMTDLETELEFPVDLTDGNYEIRMNEAFKVKELDEEFPQSCLTNAKSIENGKAVLYPETILEYHKFTADDEQRPVMNGIYITPEGICASDAHQLRYNFKPEDAACHVEKGFIALFKPSLPLLAICKLKDITPITAELYSDPHPVIKFETGEITIIQRCIEGTYPNYKGIIPNWKEIDMDAWEFDSKAVSLMASTQKNFSRSATILLSDNSCKIVNSDLKLNKEFKDGIRTSTPQLHEPDGLLMPIQTNSEKDVIIGLNSELLKNFTSWDSKVILGIRYKIDSKTNAKVYNMSAPMAVWVINTQRDHASNAPETIRQKETEVKPETKQETKALSAPVPAGANSNPEPKQDMPKQKPEYHYKKRTQTNQEINIVDYSEKAIAVFGNTKPYKNKFLNIYGRFNPNLHIDNEKIPGWIFSKKRREEIEKLIAC